MAIYNFRINGGGGGILPPLEGGPVSSRRKKIVNHVSLKTVAIFITFDSNLDIIFGKGTRHEFETRICKRTVRISE